MPTTATRGIWQDAADATLSAAYTIGPHPLTHSGGPHGQRRPAQQQDGEETQEGHFAPQARHVRPPHAADDGGVAARQGKEQVAALNAPPRRRTGAVDGRARRRPAGDRRRQGRDGHRRGDALAHCPRAAAPGPRCTTAPTTGITGPGVSQHPGHDGPRRQGARRGARRARGGVAASLQRTAAGTGQRRAATPSSRRSTASWATTSTHRQPAGRRDGAAAARPADAARGPRVLLLRARPVHDRPPVDARRPRPRAGAGARRWATPRSTPRYNSGRHICANGAELAARWKTAGELAGSGGEPDDHRPQHGRAGRAQRAAPRARRRTCAGPRRLRQLVFLGTPHHGAPLERGGNWLHPRAGHQPLRGALCPPVGPAQRGHHRPAPWQPDRTGRGARAASAHRDTRAVVPLAARQSPAMRSPARWARRRREHEWLGDGLVPLASALGRHAKPTHDLRIPPSHQWIARGVNHLGLLGSEAVYRRLRRWLGPAAKP